MSSITWKTRMRPWGGLALLPVLGLMMATAEAQPMHKGAAAESGGPGGCAMKMDLDKDGKISAEEARKMSERPFNYLDGNGDGKISKKEFVSEEAREKVRRKRREERRARHFAKLDKNGDGKVTLDEFSAARAGHMKKMRGAGMDDDSMEGMGPMMHGDMRRLGHDMRRMAMHARHRAMMGLCGDVVEQEVEE